MINKKRQDEILNYLKKKYPHYCDGEELVRQDQEELDMAVLFYLQEHGLIEAPRLGRTIVGSFVISRIIITSKGLDYLSSDGGLSAELQIKFNHATLQFSGNSQEFILEIIESSKVPEEKKSKFRKALSLMSEEGLKTISRQMIIDAISKIPDQISKTPSYLDELIRSLFG